MNFSFAPLHSKLSFSFFLFSFLSLCLCLYLCLRPSFLLSFFFLLRHHKITLLFTVPTLHPAQTSFSFSVFVLFSRSLSLSLCHFLCLSLSLSLSLSIFHSLALSLSISFSFSFSSFLYPPLSAKVSSQAFLEESRPKVVG
mmetsp:Transcript_23911/g.66967  ORF Transcript_23911/g.66967 Transcript_23911/m.66967 type:complete len:141 (+) Transcript_23911:1845-2267(+)